MCYPWMQQPQALKGLRSFRIPKPRTLSLGAKRTLGHPRQERKTTKKTTKPASRPPPRHLAGEDEFLRASWGLLLTEHGSGPGAPSPRDYRETLGLEGCHYTGLLEGLSEGGREGGRER